MEDLLEDKTYEPYLFKPIFIDLAHKSDQELQQHGAMGPIDLIFKHIFDPPSLDLTDQLFGYLEDTDSEIRQYGLQYILSRFDLDSQQLIEQALQHFDEELVMSAAQQLIDKGKEEGVQQGMYQNSRKIAKRMLARGQRPGFIKEITGLSLEEIRHLDDEEE